MKGNRKEVVNYTRSVNFLRKLFNELNEEFFEGMLEESTVTVQSTPLAYGHVTKEKTWMNSRGEHTRELNISADWLSRDETELVSTMLHEMVHLAFLSDNRDKIKVMDGIVGEDVTRYYHHKKTFAKVAERVGLKISFMDKTHGWTITEPTERILDFCVSHNIEAIGISRTPSFYIGTGGTSGDGTTKKPPRVKKPSSTRKYICPKCGQSIRATKDVNILCGDCMETMVKAE